MGKIKIQKYDVIKMVLDGKRPPYVPWSCSFTHEAEDKLKSYYTCQDLEEILENHIIGLGSDIGFLKEIGNDCVQDVFGVIWDRSVDKDIGIVKGQVLPEPTLQDYTFPNPLDKRFFADITDKLTKYGDRFRVFRIGFSLYERAWTLRGMENLMLDFYDNPAFVSEFFNTIADYNLAQIKEALKYDIDGIYFGDDWGTQRGLQMSPSIWREFILPVLKRMYGYVRSKGKYVLIHSCGDVDELFDDLIGVGLNCFNPFQPEVMDVMSLFRRYRGRLAFHGGLSTQKTLPYGSMKDVKAETNALIDAGMDGGYIFTPAHAVEGDVPLENILVFLDTFKQRRGNT